MYRCWKFIPYFNKDNTVLVISLLLNIKKCFLIGWSLHSPAFTKLEEWLENLKMHLQIRLPIVSELDQMHKAFWENHTKVAVRPENGLHPHPEQPE